MIWRGSLGKENPDNSIIGGFSSTRDLIQITCHQTSFKREMWFKLVLLQLIVWLAHELYMQTVRQWCQGWFGVCGTVVCLQCRVCNLILDEKGRSVCQQRNTSQGIHTWSSRSPAAMAMNHHQYSILSREGTQCLFVRLVSCQYGNAWNCGRWICTYLPTELKLLRENDGRN